MIQKEDERKERDYLTLVPESWIYLPGSFEDRGNRSCAACEQNNNLANNNNKKSGQYEEAEPDSKLIPRVPCKKNNPKPDKIRQKNTSRYYGILWYCILYKNSGYPELRYKYQRSDQWNEFYRKHTKKYLDRRLDKRDAAVKKFHIMEKNIHNHMKALRKHNKNLFNMTKKNISCKELHKVNNIKPRYNSPNITNINSSDYDLDSSISSLLVTETTIIHW